MLYGSSEADTFWSQHSTKILTTFLPSWQELGQQVESVSIILNSVMDPDPD